MCAVYGLDPTSWELFSCVSFMYACEYTCEYTCIWKPEVDFFNCFAPEFRWLAHLRDPSMSTFPALRLQACPTVAPIFLCVCYGLNSGPHTCIASTLSTDSSLQHLRHFSLNVSLGLLHQRNKILHYQQ